MKSSQSTQMFTQYCEIVQKIFTKSSERSGITQRILRKVSKCLVNAKKIFECFFNRLLILLDRIFLNYFNSDLHMSYENWIFQLLNNSQETQRFLR